jgi:hypothetical protein
VGGLLDFNAGDHRARLLEPDARVVTTFVSHVGGFWRRVRRPALIVVAGSALVVGAARILTYLLAPDFFLSALGGDYLWFRDQAQRWLDGGSWYLPHQLAGPYDNTSGNLYPPSTLALFLPFTFLPAILWWAIPIGIVAAAIFRYRPGAWGWALIGVCLALPAISIVHLINGNTTLWIAALVAIGLRWGMITALIAPIKPSLVPLAFLGARTRSWWVGAVVIVALNIPLLPMWFEYVIILRNATGDQATFFYSTRDLPIVAIPLIAYASRRSQASPATASSPTPATRHS